MKISLVRDVKPPVRGSKKSAGLDFFIPEDFPDFKGLAPGEDILIPSGVKANVPEGYALVAMNKSGMSTKYRLQVGACVVDEDYQGEIHIHVYNTGTSHIVLKKGMKLVQMLLVPVYYADIEIVPLNELYLEDSERGEGGFGSTGIY